MCRGVSSWSTLDGSVSSWTSLLLPVFLLLASLLAFSACATVTGGGSHDPGQAQARGAGAEEVIFYPTYGYEEDGDWVIPVRYWVVEDRNWLTGVVMRVASSFSEMDPDGRTNLRERLRHFTADSEWLERITFQFDDDPYGEAYQVTDDQGRPRRTDRNGVVEGTIRIPEERLRAIRAAQDPPDDWLRWQAVSRGHEGAGKVLLLPAEGTSVISDIDDTVRITGIPEGWRVAVRNTFVEEFQVAPGMPELYAEWASEGDVAFHYVSGSPWQLFRPLEGFLFTEGVGYPRGTVHMRSVRKNLISVGTWQDLWELVTAGAETAERKYTVIEEMMERFPERSFRLVGDTGEGDPEVYRRLAEQFPHQVEEIVIRDVTLDRIHRPERLEGMTVIPAHPAPVRARGWP